MHLSRSLLITVLCASIVSLSSCRKPKVKNAVVAQSLKDHFNFKVGSYWIFRDAVNGSTDSLYVTSNHLNIGTNSSSYYTESIEMVLMMTSQDSASLPQIWEFTLTSKSANLLIHEITGIDNQEFFIYPFATGYQGPNSYMFDILPNFELNSQQFQQVAKINYTYLKDTNTFYLTDHDFVVKMSLVNFVDSQRNEFELLRKNITIE